MTKKTDHDRRMERLDQIFAEGEQRGHVLANVTMLTDAFKLQVLIEATEQQRELMEARKSSVILCGGYNVDQAKKIAARVAQKAGEHGIVPPRLPDDDDAS